MYARKVRVEIISLTRTLDLDPKGAEIIIRNHLMKQREVKRGDVIEVGDMYFAKVLEIRPSPAKIGKMTEVEVVLHQDVLRLRQAYTSFRSSEELIWPKEVKEMVLYEIKLLKHSKYSKLIGEFGRRGILLYGRPGTGKSEGPVILAREEGVDTKEIFCTDLQGVYAGEGAKLIEMHFEELTRTKRPTLLMLEEIEALALPSFSYGLRGDAIELRNAIISGLDRLAKSKAPVLPIATTNNVEVVDPAVLSRFPKRINVDVRGERLMSKVIDVYSKRAEKIIEVNIDKSSVIPLVSDLSPRDVKNLFKIAVEKAIIEGKKVLGTEDLLKAYKVLYGTIEETSRYHY